MATWALFSLLAVAATADLVTWDGAGTNNLWDNPANWNPSKIPQPTDDVTLPPKVNVLIGTAQGGNVKSLTVSSGSTLSIIGCSLKVAGNLAIKDSTVLVNAGAGTLSAATTWINGTSSVTWGSGNIAGNFYVDQAASFDINGGGLQGCHGGMTANHGKLTIRGGVLLNSSCTIHNWGHVSVSSPTAKQQTTLVETHVENHGGSVAIEGSNTVGAQILEANDLTISADINFRPEAQVWLYNAQFTSSFTIIEPSTVFLRNVTGGGDVKTIGAGARITATEGVALGDVTMGFGYIECVNGTLAVNNIMATGGIFDLAAACPTKVKAITAKYPFFLHGAAEVTANTIDLSDQTTIDVSLKVVEKAVINCQVLTLNGMLDLGSANVHAGCVSDCGVPHIWNPADSTKPGSLSFSGTMFINDAIPTGNYSLIVHSINVMGAFDMHLVNNLTKVDIQNMDVKLGTITLGSLQTMFAGETIGLSYDKMIGPSVGARIGIAYDGAYETCNSPCTGKGKPQFPYQYFQAIPSV